jgi:hypothetical protein
MANCIPGLDGVTCQVCGRVCTFWRDGKFPSRNCIAKGPGDYLHDAIRKWTGEQPTKQCACQDRINAMNTNGPAWCRKNIDTIVGWLADEAKQRDWWRFAVAVPGSRLFIKRMVLGAIVKAEKASASIKAPPQTPLPGGKFKEGA